jgi:hypothetical protein
MKDKSMERELEKKIKMRLDSGSYVECGWYQCIDKNGDDKPTVNKYLFQKNIYG